MEQLFYREIKDDPNLRVRLMATYDGNTAIDVITLPLTSVSVYLQKYYYIGFALQMNRDLASTANDFFYKYEGQRTNEDKLIGVRFSVFFDNEETFYDFYYPFYVAVQHNAPGGGAILHSQIKLTHFELHRNGINTDPYMLPSAYETAAESEEIIHALLQDCMNMQAQNPPRPLTPIEIMRRNAARRFSTVETISPRPGGPDGAATQGNGPAIFDPSILKITKGSENPEKDLEKIVGLELVKQEFDKMQASIMMQKERAERLGLPTIAHSGHMCFMGAPGTGKTTIARVVAGVLYKAGVIRKNQCVEVAGLDLLGNYIGHTTPRTQAIIDHAAGGVLFIDEAYAITTSSYGKEAIGVLLKEMEDNRSGLVVILAGYEKDMNNLLQMNEGFRSRINRYFSFENYTVSELSKLLMFNLRARNLVIEADALEACLHIMARESHAPNFSNGRYVRNFVEQLEDQHIKNFARTNDLEHLNLITIDDVPRKETT